MPKSDNDNKTLKRRAKKSSNEVSTTPAKKRAKRGDGQDSIAKSMQLVDKLQSRKKPPTSSKNGTLRICSNGKPMPSLADLEKMFEDSDEEQSNASNITGLLERCKTPEQSNNEDIMKPSPTTISNYANNILNLVSKLPNPIMLDNDTPQPIIPVKRSKKSAVPYIVGCKDRPKVIKKGKGYMKQTNSIPDKEDENSHSKKHCKSTKCGQLNISQSIFKATSKEITERLKELEDANSNDSSDSNKTEPLEMSPNSSYGPIRTFSPLPSTSRDNITILKNEELFNDSIISPPDVEVIEVPYETIVIDDTPLKYKSRLLSGEIIIIDTPVASPIQIVDKPSTHINTESPVDIDYYSSLDTNQHHQDEDSCEVTDIDNLIAENKIIIDKIPTERSLNTVTHVQSSNYSNLTTAPNSNLTAPNSSIHCTKSNSIDQTVKKFFDQSTTTGLSYTQRNKNTNICHLPIQENSLNNSPRDTIAKQNVSTRNNTPDDDSVVIVNDVIIETPMKCPENVKRKKNQRKSKTNNISLTSSPSPPQKNLGDCPICMDILGNTPVASTTCGHLFCLSCIKKSLEISRKKCPTCRKSLKGNGYHPIYL